MAMLVEEGKVDPEGITHYVPELKEQLGRHYCASGAQCAVCRRWITKRRLKSDPEPRL
ncbi:hypothetical protein O9993_06825 [Vibrio lentus]|nr:hypothetical protein [Vibrio lentus]